VSDDSYASVSVTPHEGDDVPTPSALRFIGVWNHHVKDYRFYHHDNGAQVEYINDAMSEFGDGLHVNDNDGSVSMTTQTKYEVGGMLEFCEHLSRSYPQAVVRLHREWTGDGQPATEEFIWEGGVRTAMTVDDVLPVGFAGTAKAIADTLQDDIGRNYLSDPVAHTALIGTINRTIEFLRSLSS
jgi:hypothetical protein